MTEVEIFASGLDHPEGLAFDRDGVLWAGGEAGQIYRIDSNGFQPDGASEVMVEGMGYVNGLCFDGDGTLYIAESDSRRVVRLDGSVVAGEVGSRRTAGRPS